MTRSRILGLVVIIVIGAIIGGLLLTFCTRPYQLVVTEDIVTLRMSPFRTGSWQFHYTTEFGSAAVEGSSGATFRIDPPEGRLLEYTLEFRSDSCQRTLVRNRPIELPFTRKFDC